MTTAIASSVKERPVLMSAPMVRALLDGTKTQTRRVIRKPERLGCVTGHDCICISHGCILCEDLIDELCPYGAPGSLLWVRETHSILDGRPNVVLHPQPYPPTEPWSAHVGYRADEDVDTCDRFIRDLPPSEWRESFDADHVIWRPSIFMPRWASRITLEITDVRVERLQNISGEDAEAEGLVAWSKDGKMTKYGVAERDGMPGCDEAGAWPWHRWRISPVDAYEALWDSINAKRAPWSSNPWCWALTFKVVS